MELPQRRDINELLANGFFKTAQAKSHVGSTPMMLKTTAVPPYYSTGLEMPLHHSRIRKNPVLPPPRPLVEDEMESLAKESVVSVPCYDPPSRGVIDQHPIILEAGVTKDTAARLQDLPDTPVFRDDDNQERRFVLLPKSVDEIRDDKSRKNDLDRDRVGSPRLEERLNNLAMKEDGEDGSSNLGDRMNSLPNKDAWDHSRKIGDSLPYFSAGKRLNRKHLPSLEIKVAGDIPQQYVCSASPLSGYSKGSDIKTVHTTSSLSGHSRGSDIKPPTPRYTQDNLGGQSGSPVIEKRRSGSQFGSRPGTPGLASVDRNNGRLQDVGERRAERYTCSDTDRVANGVATGLAAGVVVGAVADNSFKSSQSKIYYSSDEDFWTTSDPESRRRRYPQHRLKKEKQGHRSSSTNRKSPLELKHGSRQGSRLNSPLESPKMSPGQPYSGDYFRRIETNSWAQDSRGPVSKSTSPFRDEWGPSRLDKRSHMEITKPRQVNSIGSAGHMAAPYPDSVLVPVIDMPEPDMRQTPSSERTSSNTRSQWQQTMPLQPPSRANFEQPVEIKRRYSEEVQRYTIIPLPTCPRKDFVRGKYDWLTLPQCPNFDICPSCYESTIRPTEFGKLFIASPPRPADVDVLCDFGSSPWYRIAWLLTLKERRQDLKLFYGLANTALNIQPCHGKREVVRKWYSITDPRTGNPIRGFDICYSCVKNVEVLLPTIRGVFIPVNQHSPVPRICDFRFDNKRFVQYFDELEIAASKASYDGTPPDTRALVSLARNLTMDEECQKETDLLERRWHIIPQLPEFTVCEECFDEVVWPELRNGKMIPAMFSKEKKRIPKASCQLYSRRMRDIFQLAVSEDDYKMLALKARERKEIEGICKASLTELRRRPSGETKDREVRRILENWKRWE